MPKERPHPSESAFLHLPGRSDLGSVHLQEMTFATERNLPVLGRLPWCPRSWSSDRLFILATLARMLDRFVVYLLHCPAGLC